MAITKRKGSHPHTEWIDLKGNGVMIECAVLKEDGFGNTYFIEIPPLDGIDKNRLVRIVNSRSAPNFELWDLMSQVTLNNGINALEYFHQLVKVITPQGVIMNPRSGHIGTGAVDTGSVEQMTAIDLKAPVESVSEKKDLTPAQKRAATIAAKKVLAEAEAAEKA